MYPKVKGAKQQLLKVRNEGGRKEVLPMNGTEREWKKHTERERENGRKEDGLEMRQQL